MNDIGKRFIGVAIYAAAMALLEAVVVVYIRGGLLWTAGGSQFTVVSYMTMEIWREAATVVMLVAVGWLAGRQATDRWAYGIFAFGLWDIGYCHTISTKFGQTYRSNVTKMLHSPV